MLRGHESITSTVTFNQHLLPIFQARCISCHREGGAVFSLETYAAARPWAKAIEEEVLRRRMPPWGAVPGFGEFLNDPSLSMIEMQRIAEWAEGGAPEGEPVEPQAAAHRQSAEAAKVSSRAMEISGPQPISQSILLQGLKVSRAPEESSIKLLAETPDGARVPLIWIQDYSPALPHVFQLRTPLSLPAGTVIRGLPEGAAVALFSIAATDR
jgi:hypothetical protein